MITVNAAQTRVLDKNSFEMLFELARALRLRPTAFDGGIDRATAVPDVILLQEMRFSNLEIFKRLIKQRYPYMYEIVGLEDATAKILVNLDTVELTGAAGTWDDACLGGKDEGGRTYQWLGLIEKATALPVTVATVHFSHKYNQLEGQTDCLARNVAAMRGELDQLPGTIVIGGDFNKRATEGTHECDPNEEAEELTWYAEMLSGDEYQDAAKVARKRKGSMESEWTFERKSQVPGCGGSHIFKRSRIDFLFVRDAIVGEAGADDPGWWGGEPGVKHPTNFKYSDHRFVSARLVLSSVPRAGRPLAEPASGGLVRVSWNPVPEATGYVVYRANGRKPFDEWAVVGVEDTTFEDRATSHGQSYRYAIAALGATGRGWESVPMWATADARGPKVVAVNPSRGTSGVPVTASVEVRFDERVILSGRDPLRLVRSGNRVAGTLTQAAPRVLRFTPASRLRKGTTYRVVVNGTSDVLGNAGPDDSWSFTTVARGKKRR